MMLSRRKFLGTASAAVAAFGVSGCAAKFGSSSSYLTPILHARNQSTVFHWIDIVLQQIRDQRLPPPRAAYNLAMPTVAGFLAANAINQKYHESFGIGSGPQNADPEIAYGVAFAAAAAEVFQQPFLFETQAFTNRFGASESKSRGIEWGKRVARHIIQLRTNDGSDPSKVNYYPDQYKKRQDSLHWKPTGPFYSAKPGPAFNTYARPLFPGHGAIKPWTMSSGSQFRAGEFYDPASPEFAAEYDQIRRLGGKDSKIRTGEQEEIALFWEDGPWGLTPPGHFMLIATQILQHRQLTFLQQARAFALLGMTQCDASINAWDNKYAYDIIRPETAIRHRAPKFGNYDRRVTRQSNWQSFIPTPEFPAYTSGHSTFGAAAAKMIELIYGRDDVSFGHEAPDQVIWPQLQGKRRNWTSLSQMAEENGMSRLYGGVHWEADHDLAMDAGRKIAQQAHHSLFQMRA